MFVRKHSHRHAWRLALCTALCAAGLGCGADVPTPAGEAQAGRAASPETAAEAEAPDAPESASESAESGAPLVAFLGDSLTAGFGLAKDRAYPAVIERTLREEGHPIRLLNAGVSGDTSAGGLNRLPAVLKQHPDVLVVALGGNDGLRGLPTESIRKNLKAIVEAAREQGAQVLLLGLKMPPNYGPEYTESFERIYPDVADELDVPLVPFMLAGVAGDPELNQGDGIHPTADGQALVAGNVLPALRELLGKSP